jgi:TPR repeat protein
MKRVMLSIVLLTGGCFVDVSGCKMRLIDRNECSEANPSVDACERKCDAGEWDACVLAAEALGEFQAERQERSLQRACAASHANACRLLGVRFGDGKHGFEVDAARAAPLMERGCELGNANACHGSGALAYRGALGSPDLAKARREFKRACDLGAQVSCAMLGNMHEIGEGGPADQDAAVVLYRQACEANAVAGCHGLGSLIARGKLAGSKLEAKRLFEKACEEEFDDSCEQLASLE